ncbi:MAG: hypothetical protein JST59_25205 [Actinobacteria bacterium]|nr:hypothetical protein [Actinomycetota bacterium]
MSQVVFSSWEPSPAPLEFDSLLTVLAPVAGSDPAVDEGPLDEPQAAIATAQTASRLTRSGN